MPVDIDRVGIADFLKDLGETGVIVRVYDVLGRGPRHRGPNPDAVRIIGIVDCVAAFYLERGKSAPQVVGSLFKKLGIAGMVVGIYEASGRRRRAVSISPTLHLTPRDPLRKRKKNRAGLRRERKAEIPGACVWLCLPLCMID